MKMQIIPRWYRFLYWRLFSWYRDWKRLDPFLSAVWAAVWLWILHALNVGAVAISVAMFSEDRGERAFGWLLNRPALGMFFVAVVLAVWSAALLLNRPRIEKEFQHRERLRFTTVADLAVVAYNVATLIAFLVPYLMSFWIGQGAS